MGATWKNVPFLFINIELIFIGAPLLEITVNSSMDEIFNQIYNVRVDARRLPPRLPEPGCAFYFSIIWVRWRRGCVIVKVTAIVPLNETT